MQHFSLLTLCFALISVVLTATSCRSPSGLTAKQDVTSKLHYVYDGTHSLILQKDTSDSYRFLTCNGSLDNLDMSSCTTAIKTANGEALDYTFMTSDTLAAEDIGQIDRLKQELAQELLEDGEFPDDLSIVNMGMLSGALIASNAVGANFGGNAKRILRLVKQEKLLEAKLLFSTLVKRNAFKNSEHLTLINTFKDPDNLSLLESQASMKWDALRRKAENLYLKNKNTRGIAREIVKFHDDVSFWQFDDFTLIFHDYEQVQKSLVPQTKAQQRSAKPAVTQNKRRYKQAAAKAKTIKTRFIRGEFDEALDAWRSMKDHWLLDETDRIDYQRDVLPHRTHPKYVQKLKTAFRSLHAQGLQKIQNGENVYFLLGEQGELHRVHNNLNFAGLQDDYNNRARSTLMESLEKQAQAKDLLKVPPAAEKPAAANAALAKGGMFQKASKGRKMILTKAKQALGTTARYTGWGMSLVAGLGIIFAVIQNADSKTLTNLDDLTNTQNSVSAVPFVPVSIYSDYWPALTSLDPTVSLEVPSVTSVLKTLALHASGGNVSLAKELSYCLPAEPNPSCYSLELSTVNKP